MKPFSQRRRPSFAGEAGHQGLRPRVRFNGSHAAQKHKRMKNVGCQGSESTYVVRPRSVAGFGFDPHRTELRSEADVSNIVVFPALAGRRPMLQEQESLLHRIGKAFRTEGEGIAHEPLPKRWVDLTARPAMKRTRIWMLHNV